MDGVFVSIGHDYCSGECMAFDGKVKSYESKVREIGILQKKRKRVYPAIQLQGI